jgi:hypothetical protein
MNGDTWCDKCHIYRKIIYLSIALGFDGKPELIINLKCKHYKVFKGLTQSYPKEE